MSTLAEKVRAARESAGLSQADLAERVGVSQQAIAQIETGATDRPRFLHDIAAALGLEAADLDERVARGTAPKSKASNGAQLILKIDRAVTLDQAARIFAILDEKP